MSPAKVSKKRGEIKQFKSSHETDGIPSRLTGMAAERRRERQSQRPLALLFLRRLVVTQNDLPGNIAVGDNQGIKALPPTDVAPFSA